MTSSQVLKQLKKFVEGHGSQTEAAKAVPCSVPYLHDVLHGKRQPGPKILKALGLKKAYVRA